MRRLFDLPSCIVGLTAGVLFFAACGQNEGGRCQIDSDCASGLECSDKSGNGTCRKKGAVVTSDAALKDDVGEDVAVPFTSEVGSEATLPAIDGESVDQESLDSGSLDSTGLD